MVNTFDIIKETLKIADILTFYGMVFNRSKALWVMYQTIGMCYNHLKTKVDDYEWQLSKLSVHIAVKQIS